MDLSKYDYAEVRIEESSESITSIKNDEVSHSSGKTEGRCARVLENGSWGFASGTGDVNILLDRAQRLARLSKGKIRIEPPGHRKEIVGRFEHGDSEGQIKALLEAAREMKGDAITSQIINYTEIALKTGFYNSHGARIIQESGYGYLSCSAIAKSNGIIQRGSERTWSRSGFQDIDLLAVANKSKEKALRLLKAEPPPKGRFDTVFDPEMTGVFSHEAVGHACEADSIVDGESILAGKTGREIGTELVTIVDDPTATDFGHYVYDEEGVLAKPAVLIEKGILKGYMNSLETACNLREQPNGHARADSYDQVPIVRMSNTYFQKGDHSLQDVFDIDGIYLKGMKGGSVDTFSGGFMFKAEEAWEIKKGERVKIMRDAVISGNILETMANVTAVGKDFGTSPGICGKFGQSVPVSDGGPHIQVKGVAIG
ncbi:TldD/PmbA family protein [Candidatus Micrarchaeota archaeon]|nr:TldD/PmbA family protein [Candidatus Micrarchaeota archaeon]